MGLGVRSVVVGNTRGGVVGVVDSVLDELPDVAVLDAVEDLGALAAGAQQASQPQLREVLGHASRWLSDCFRQLVHGQLVIEKSPEHPHPGGVGQHPEDLDSKVHLLGRR